MMKNILHHFSILFLCFCSFSVVASNQPSRACSNLSELDSESVSPEGALALYYSCGESLFNNYVIFNVGRMAAKNKKNEALNASLALFRQDNGNTLTCSSCHLNSLSLASVKAVAQQVIQSDSSMADSLIRLINPHITADDFRERRAKGEGIQLGKNLSDKGVSQRLLHHSTDSFEKIEKVFSLNAEEIGEFHRQNMQSLLAYMQVHTSMQTQEKQQQMSCETCHKPNTITSNLMLSIALQENILRSNCSRCHVEEREGGIGDATNGELGW